MLHPPRDFAEIEVADQNRERVTSPDELSKSLQPGFKVPTTTDLVHGLKKRCAPAPGDASLPAAASDSMTTTPSIDTASSSTSATQSKHSTSEDCKQLAVGPPLGLWPSTPTSPQATVIDDQDTHAVRARDGDAVGRPCAMPEPSSAGERHSDKSHDNADEGSPGGDCGNVRAPLQRGTSSESVVAPFRVVAHPGAAPVALPNAPVEPARRSDSKSEPTQTPAVPESLGGNGQSPESTIGVGLVNVAHLTEKLRYSGINLNLRTSDLGDVAIHTVLSHDRVSAQIYPDRGDVARMIAVEVATLQARLSQEHGIQAAIEVQQQGRSFSSGSGHSQQHSGRQQPADRGGFVPEITEAAASQAAADAGGGLDVRF